MMNGYEKDLKEDQAILILKRKAEELKNREFGNEDNICPYERRSRKGHEDNYKIQRTIHSTVSLKDETKYLNDKENNYHEAKENDLYERRSYKRSENDDQLKNGAHSTVSLKERTKHFRDTAGGKENNYRYPYERKVQKRYESDDQLKPRTQASVSLRETVNLLKDTARNGHERYENNGKPEAKEQNFIVRLKQKAKQFQARESHSPPETNQDNGYELDKGDEAIARLKAKAKYRRGRGLDDNERNTREGLQRMSSSSCICHEYDNAVANEPQRSVNVWTLFVTNISTEADEDDIQEKFCDYGAILYLSVNVDRRTGFCKGYALAIFETYKEAAAAKDALNGAEIMGQPIEVDWCFVKAGGRVDKTAN